jgi:EAL domain-containing protein (putative c-di-GMP-specific phosphodiesterase class I)
VCARYHLRPSGIVFELTESTAVDDPGVLLDVMTRLRLKGFGLALDDFGTGYASLQQLHRLPFRQLKIDRWFVQEASRDDRSRRIIEHSLNLASQLGLSTVAEGVDSEAGLELMTRLGCDTAQGYFIARPMPAADVTRWIDAR